jgi:hypothetical protein
MLIHVSVATQQVLIDKTTFCINIDSQAIQLTEKNIFGRSKKKIKTSKISDESGSKANSQDKPGIKQCFPRGKTRGGAYLVWPVFRLSHL